jgi:phage terminase small subunit
MPILTDPRWEIFAQNAAKGMSLTAAYGAAGYRRSGSNAWRLSKNERVLARITELKALAAGEAGITIQRVIDEVAKVAFANIADYLEFTKSGDPQIKLASVTREQMAAVQKLVVDIVEVTSASVMVKRVHLKLHSKLDALEKLGKYLGAWGKDASVAIPPPVATTKTRKFNWDALTQEELEQLNAINRRLTAAAGPNA